MFADRQTDRWVDHNTPHPYRGRVKISVTVLIVLLAVSSYYLFGLVI